jgi:hypothetical protein
MKSGHFDLLTTRLSNLAPEFVNRNKNDSTLSKQFNSREPGMCRM